MEGAPSKDPRIKKTSKMLWSQESKRLNGPKIVEVEKQETASAVKKLHT